jgi:hypothetical protein
MPAAPSDAADAAQSMDIDDPEPEDAAADEPAPRRRKSVLRRILGLWRRLDRRLPGVIWVKKMISFPIGERFAAISLTAALFGPRTTFIVLLSWGGFALTYTMIGRVMRSAA